MRGSLQHQPLERRREIARLGADASRRERAFTIYCGHWVRSRKWLVDRLRMDFEKAEEAEAVAS